MDAVTVYELTMGAHGPTHKILWEIEAVPDLKGIVHSGVIFFEK